MDTYILRPNKEEVDLLKLVMNTYRGKCGTAYLNDWQDIKTALDSIESDEPILVFDDDTQPIISKALWNYIELYYLNYNSLGRAQKVKLAMARNLHKRVGVSNYERKSTNPNFVAPAARS